MKPELPKEIQALLPEYVVCHIQKFVPHIKKSPPPSPSLLRELDRIQRSPLRGKNEMYMKDYDDFILS
jgi:hypothetical protein